MAFTPEQEQALLSLLNEKKVTLSELPAATSANVSDLLLTRQGITDKSITASVLKSFFAPEASTSSAGVTKLSSELNSDSEAQAATSKAVKGAIAASLQKSANLSDLADSQKALQNLGIAEMLLPIGVPLPWPTATPPSGWLKCNGAAFNKASYPQLALAYPTGVLPDLRGEFIRGWDDGRGADAGRILLSSQGDAIRNAIGEQSLAVPYNGKSTGVFYNKGKNANEGAYEDGSEIHDAPSVGGSGGIDPSHGEKIYFDLSRAVPTANENRPRNIAFNYIVRAA